MIEGSTDTIEGAQDVDKQIGVADGTVREIGALPPGTIIDEEALARMFHRHSVSVKRAVERGELPAPMRLFGKPCWTVAAILNHLTKRLDAAQRERDKAIANITQLSP